MKTLRVDTSNQAIHYEENKSDYQYLGNRGLIAKVAMDEIRRDCDPLGSENKFIIAQSLLAGTNLTTSGRMSIGGKSPLTGGIKESNVGGMVGKAFTEHDIKVVIIEGMPLNNELYILLVENDGTAKLVERNDLAGTGNYSVVKQLRESYGEDTELLVCGPAGEKLFKNACVMATDFSTKEPCRAGGRGGLGAVLGAKGIKAIVVKKALHPYKASPALPEEFKTKLIKFHKATATHAATQARKKFGTFGGVRNNETNGILPVKNFRSIHFDAIDKIDGQAIVDQLERNGGRYGLSCQSGCIIKCANYYVNSYGQHTASSLNYETLGLCGPNCMIEDLDDIAEIKQLCDDFGIDSIEMGAAIGLFMEAGLIPWGDGKAAIDMIKDITKDGQYSKFVGQGLIALGKELGVTRVPAVRGQAFAAYDVRNNKGMGLSYLAGTMGADHTFGSGRPDQEGSYVSSSIYDLPAKTNI